ncbi:hypothetical protein [Acidithiobacillus sp.]
MTNQAIPWGVSVPLLRITASGLVHGQAASGAARQIILLDETLNLR